MRIDDFLSLSIKDVSHLFVVSHALLTPYKVAAGPE